MSTIFLLLDAFRYDYLSKENTPFLWRCANEGEHYTEVVPSLGFCERTEVLTGLKGDKSGFFTAVGFDPPGSPFANVKGLAIFHAAEQAAFSLLKFVPRIPGNKIHKRLRSYIQGYFIRHGITMPSFQIPYTWLPYFSLTEDKIDHRRPEAFSHPSILSLLQKAGKSYFYDSFTAVGLPTPYRTDQQRLNAVANDLANDKKDLYLIYISAPDAFGHLYGPESEKLKRALYEMDMTLEQFVDQAESAAAYNRYIFVGDHGMLPVSECFDAGEQIETCLREGGLKKKRDIIYFLDSTMVRLWALNDRAEEVLPNLLQKAPGFKESGTWVNAGIAERYHIPWPDRRYGDYLWLANPGVLVFPDFFHRSAPCKGMHGYDPQLTESRGVCIEWGTDIQHKQHDAINLTDVYDLLKRSLGV